MANVVSDQPSAYGWAIDDSTPAVDAALAYYHAGLKPIALHRPKGAGCTCRKPECRSVGKHPVSRSWQKTTYASDDEVRDAFALTFEPNVGLVMGVQPDGHYLVAVDVDDAERLLELEAELGPLPPTLTCSSARGDRRLFILPRPDNIKNVTGIGDAPGVDLKAEGGQVAVAPSLHASGTYYRWTHVTAPVELPGEWCLAVRPEPSPGELRQYTPQELIADTKKLERAKKWLNTAVTSECADLARAREGTRNSALTKAAWKLYSCANGVAFAGAFDFVTRELTRAAQACGLKDEEIRPHLATAIQRIRDSGTMRMPQLVTPGVWPSSSGGGGPAATGGTAFGGVQLIMDRGQPATVSENVARLLALHPRWAGGPRTDDYSGLIFWPDGRLLENQDYDRVQAWCYEQNFRVGTDVAERGVRLAAKRGRFDSQAKWLEELPAWDKRPRIKHWLATYLGMPDDNYNQVTGRAWFLAVVHRAMNPGCVVDVVPVLYGDQGIGKNRSMDILFKPERLGIHEWKANIVKFDPDSPDLKRLSTQRWVLMDDEGQALKPRLLEKAKAWISTTSEQYVAKYENEVTVAPRRSLLVISTNEHEFLTDPSGNRRFFVWPVIKLDHEALERDRLQLFAEAKAVLAAGARWGEGVLDLMLGPEGEQRSHQVMTIHDPLYDAFRACIISGRWRGWATAHELIGMLGLGIEDRNAAQRIGFVMRQLKARRKRTGEGNKYAPPGFVDRSD